MTVPSVPVVVEVEDEVSVDTVLVLSLVVDTTVIGVSSDELVLVCEDVVEMSVLVANVLVVVIVVVPGVPLTVVVVQLVSVTETGLTVVAVIPLVWVSVDEPEEEIVVPVVLRVESMTVVDTGGKYVVIVVGGSWALITRLKPSAVANTIATTRTTIRSSFMRRMTRSPTPRDTPYLFVNSVESKLWVTCNAPLRFHVTTAKK